MGPLIVQGVGFIGLLIVIVMFQVNRRSFTLKLLVFSSIMFVIHFYLLGAWTAVAMNIIGAFRAFVFNKKESYKWLNRRETMYLFVGLFWTTGFLSWEGPLSLLPIASMSVECFALWNSNTKRIRWLMLAARPGWFIYNVVVGSYAGLATEIFLTSTLLVAVYRFDSRSDKIYYPIKHKLQQSK